MLNELSQFTTAALLNEDGVVCAYQYANSGPLISPNLYRSQQRPMLVEVNGAIVEVIMTDFIGQRSDFPVDPSTGDKITRVDPITNQTDVYEANRITGQKCFYELQGQIRIHTKKVNS